MRKESFFGLELNKLKKLLSKQKLAPFGATQLYEWIYKRQTYDSEKWSNVAKKTKHWVNNHFHFSFPEIVNIAQSTDGTCKFLLQLEDEETVEAVIIPSLKRNTLCLSSQVGCAIKCNFCHTGTQGFTRNLTTGEIITQYLLLSNWHNKNRPQEKPITNIVFMGQGEPLNNFENMKSAITILMEPKGINLGQRKITVSTSGVIKQVERLNELPPINIAISLHAAFDDIRNELIPLNKKYNLSKLLMAIKKYNLKPHRYITYEYLMIDELNNRTEDIEALTKLLDTQTAKINLIPFNEFPGSKYKCPPQSNIVWFMDQLMKKGFNCTIRYSKGEDILAACGQLKSQTITNTSETST